MVSEIIDKGYDQQQFCTFLTNRRPNEEREYALDINRWTFDELSDVVQQFQENGGSAEALTDQQNLENHKNMEKADEDDWEDIGDGEVADSKR